jgi:hypothetical protein
MNDENKNQIDIELKEDVAQGTYSNLAVITHSSSEFVVDFVRIMPGLPKAEVKSRIILTPEHAKRLMLALQDNISKYESINGKIRLDDNRGPQGPIMPMGFGGPKGEA